ncbi:hypothetical protein ACFOGI_00690 [Virgibacillus xinjiangensis]|uniref:Uncharacterized protein n=1 Tax=Virgibacillus xinjiangensis TaxID=393090 RepID=A0ABV7CR00_9BACI
MVLSAGEAANPQEAVGISRRRSKSAGEQIFPREARDIPRRENKSAVDAGNQQYRGVISRRGGISAGATVYQQ